MILTVSRGADSFIQFCTVLIIFVFVLIITWISTRWIANVQKGRSVGSNIEVIETYRLAANKYVQIIRTGEKYFAIANCKDTVTMLTEIPAEQIHISEQTGEIIPDFKKIFEKAKNSHKE